MTSLVPYRSGQSDDDSDDSEPPAGLMPPLLQKTKSAGQSFIESLRHMTVDKIAEEGKKGLCKDLTDAEIDEALLDYESDKGDDAAATLETTLFTFTFFIICDCRDPSLFHVEATAMSNYRLRYSAMKSTFKRWARSDIDEPHSTKQENSIHKDGEWRESGNEDKL